MDFVRQVLDWVVDKWSMLVIAVLEAGPLRHTDLQREVPGISQRMLTLTVRQLQHDGLVTRTAYARRCRRAWSTPSPPGPQPHHVVTSLITWVADYQDQIREHRVHTATAP
ncbi:winged helix-turn-helix transcriptional regulator [Streptomyces sp. WM6386]|uniref:winged helix-turn-helix transcriptional regulator n=1 Tax=Streptomyces sp. WM6386 TaxID=1415558 RepID=UPI000A90831F|nr:helix-turn-helix domain-containing protein [Streptomyces sp. WM6386]